MNKLEDRTLLTGRLMVGPDGAVYDLGAGTRSGDGGQASSCFSFSAPLPRRDPGVIDPCFAYGAAASADGGVIHPYFAF
jgi:hypothetical protein